MGRTDLVAYQADFGDQCGPAARAQIAEFGDRRGTVAAMVVGVDLESGRGQCRRDFAVT